MLTTTGPKSKSTVTFYAQQNAVGIFVAPHQPSDEIVIESTSHQLGKKSETHALNTSWFKKFPSIHLCVTRKKKICLIAWTATIREHRLLLKIYYDTTFVVEVSARSRYLSVQSVQ